MHVIPNTVPLTTRVFPHQAGLTRLRDEAEEIGLEFSSQPKGS